MIVQDIVTQGSFLRWSQDNPHHTPCDVQIGTTQVRFNTQGVVTFVPDQPTKAVVVSCGIHGNETAPIELCDALVMALLQGRIQVQQAVQFQFGNFPAIAQQQRYIDVNLNRLFGPACVEGHTPEHQRAQVLRAAMTDFFAAHQMLGKLHFDLHTSIRKAKFPLFAVHPAVPCWEKHSFMVDFAHASGIQAIL